MNSTYSRLQFARQPMPPDIQQALTQRGLMDSYHARPAYQQNDDLGWIARAQHPQTRTKRLQQMLDELEQGGVYMNIPHPPSRKQV